MPEGSPNTPVSTSSDDQQEINVTSPIRILIVDDHPPVRRGIRLLLSSVDSISICGEAGDGIEAIQKAKDLHPDLILMDITMPRMDGLQATRAIKQSLPETRVIIVTQNDPSIVQQQAAAVNADGVVAKSELPQQLIPAIASAAAKRDNQADPASAPNRGAGILGTHSEDNLLQLKVPHPYQRQNRRSL